MATQHPLDKLIRATPKLPIKTESFSEVLVMVSGGKASSPQKWTVKVSSLLSKATYYLVQTAEDGRAASAVTRTDLQIAHSADVSPNLCRINYTAWCPPDSALQLAEYVHRHPMFGEHVDALVRKWFSEALREIHDDHSVHRGLARQIEAQMAGRAIEANMGIHVEFNVFLPVLLRDYQVKDPIKVRVHIDGKKDQLELANIVWLSLKSAQKHLENCSRPLPAWTEETVGRVVRETVTGMEYGKLLSSFDEVKGRIKTRIGAEAEAIGYEVRHIVSDPNTDEYALSQNFLIDRTDSNLWSFETSETGVSVDLAVYVAARVRDFEKPRIKMLLAAARPLKNEIEKSVHLKLSEIMHTVKPTQFYEEFDVTNGPGLPLDARLRDAIRGVLLDFGCELQSDIIVKMGRTEIIERLDGLRKVEMPLPNLLVKRHGTGEQVKFIAVLKVDGVSPGGYARFALWASTPTKPSSADRSALVATARDELVQAIQRELQSQLSTSDVRELWFVTDGGRVDMLKRVNDWANGFSVKEYGLTVHFSTFNREQVELELVGSSLIEQRARMSGEIQSAAIQSTGKRIQVLLTDMVSATTPEERMEIQREIDALSKDLPLLSAAIGKLPSISQSSNGQPSQQQ